MVPEGLMGLSLQRRPQRDGAELVSNAIENRSASHLAEACEHLLLHEHRLEEIQILLEDLARFVEDDQQQARLADLVVAFHFSKILNDGRAPLSAVSDVADTAF